MEPGLRSELEHQVGNGETAVALGSGDVDVYATPALVALCERAAVAAMAGALDPGTTTVGVRIDLEHLAPTPPGAAVRASAELTAVHGRTLTFAIEARDTHGPVGRGTHVRVVVDRDRFAATADARR